jgi:hypothetical protein
LFRLPATRVEAGTEPSPIGLPDKVKISDQTFLTGWGYGEVVISDSESGMLAQLTDVALKTAKYRLMQQRGKEDSPVQWNQQPERPETVRRRGYPGVTAPGAIAVFNGILYVVDQKSSALFACGVHDARAIRLPPRNELITRLVANRDWLVGLDARSGRLVRFARVVPSELTLLPAARYQNLFPVLEYLYRRKLLTTRTLPLTDTIAETLDKARMKWPGRGPVAEPYSTAKDHASFCMLNPKFCAGGLPIEQPPGTPIVLADLYAERHTVATQVTLDGIRTLGEIADEAIQSQEFMPRRNEEFLRQLNGVLPGDPRVLRDAREGVFRISQEQVRYVIPIEASELRSPDGEFRRLVDTVAKTIRIAPLERVATSKAGLRLDHPDDDNCAAARAAMTSLLATINFAAAVPTRTIFVGVAEDVFDTAHRDFVNPTAPVSILYEADDDEDLKPAPMAQGTEQAGVEPVTWRAYRDDDHGTAIAAIIAGRTRPYQQGPGLSNAFIEMFTHTNDATALATDIENWLNKSQLTVVNLSLKSKGDAVMLRNAIERAQPIALFVVAAPNSTSQVILCTQNERWFPACHGQTLDNVLVVGGTTLNGEQIHPHSPKGKDVHLFAPAEGFFSAGRENGYVRVAGTSFATPLVTATAAALSSMGITSPALIKQRLITTADVIAQSTREPWARLLNVRRAVSHLGHAVIIKPPGSEMTVDIDNKDDTLRFKTVTGNRPLSFPVSGLRRLTRVKGTAPVFDLAYVIPSTDEQRADLIQLHTVKPNGEQKVCYMPLDAAGLFNGSRTCVDLAEMLDFVAPLR